MKWRVSISIMVLMLFIFSISFASLRDAVVYLTKDKYQDALSILDNEPAGEHRNILLNIALMLYERDLLSKEVKGADTFLSSDYMINGISEIKNGLIRLSENISDEGNWKTFSRTLNRIGNDFKITRAKALIHAIEMDDATSVERYIGIKKSDISAHYKNIPPLDYDEKPFEKYADLYKTYGNSEKGREYLKSAFKIYLPLLEKKRIENLSNLVSSVPNSGYILDAILSIIFIFFLIKGLIKGFTRELVGLISLVVSVVVAVKFYQSLTTYIFKNPATWHYVLSFIIIFIIVEVIFIIVSKLLRRFLKIIGLRWFDRLIGGGIGIIEGLIICQVIILLLSILSISPSIADMMNSSILVPYVKMSMGALVNIVPSNWKAYLSIIS